MLLASACCVLLRLVALCVLLRLVASCDSCWGWGTDSPQAVPLLCLSARATPCLTTHAQQPLLRRSLHGLNPKLCPHPPHASPRPSKATPAVPESAGSGPTHTDPCAVGLERRPRRGRPTRVALTSLGTGGQKAGLVPRSLAHIFEAVQRLRTRCPKACPPPPFRPRPQMSDISVVNERYLSGKGAVCQF